MEQVQGGEGFCDYQGVSRKFVRAGEIWFQVEEEGSGVPLLVIHGGPGVDHRYFHPHFSRVASFCRVIYYDLRGQGGSSEAEDELDYGLYQDSEDIEALRQSLGLEQFHIFGHSYGGYVALQYATIFPQNVLSVTVCSMPMGESEEEINLRSDEIWKRLQEEYPEEDNFYRFYFHQPPNALTLHYNNLVRKAYSSERIQKILRAYEQDEHKLHPLFSLSVILKPCYFLYGRHDPLTNLKILRDLLQPFTQVIFLIFEQSGHNPFADEPERFTEVMRNIVQDERGA